MTMRSHRCPSEKYQQKQFTLGGLIAELEKISDNTKQVYYDFCNAYPFPEPGSWRGSYDELRLPWVLNGHTSKRAPSVQELIIALKRAVNESYTGYKGGDYVMTEETPIWVDDYGDYSRTAIVGVEEEGCFVYLLTAHVEF